MTALGSVRFYFAAAGGADFGRPQTFADGARIATRAARLRNALTITAPNQALCQIEGELRQQQLREFTFRGRRYRLGRRGLRLRLEATGPGTRTDPTVPRATFDVAGHLVVAG